MSLVEAWSSAWLFSLYHYIKCSKVENGRKWQKLAEMDFRALCAIVIEVTRHKKETRN